jgi:hypothetical protein
MFTTDFHTTAVTHRVGKWIDRLNEIAPRHDWGNYGFALEMRPAAKYLRVVMTTSTGSKSVHAFVDSDGHVFKAAGWKAPA